ncbi:MAG: 5-formyltetrahydrofolate cyclo-ligase [Rickettsiales bacterium]|jgi:5-formyltetrahydrofolate cyclo-ligase|nr:5-formyltetrahydrofolate cyclo-ligase [Rickettsiales bacterium]
MLDKPTLRKQMLAKRLALSKEFRLEAAEAIIPHVLHHVHEHTIVAGYSAIRGELDVFPALHALAERGHKLCLPDIAGRDAPLVFLSWQAFEPLVKASYGIEITKEKKLVVPDVLLVPLVAFDRQGYRLGYGAGYYDQTISSLRLQNDRLKAYGIAYSNQCIDDLPIEAHDVRLDGVITEKGLR